MAFVEVVILYKTSHKKVNIQKLMFVKKCKKVRKGYCKFASFALKTFIFQII